MPVAPISAVSAVSVTFVTAIVVLLALAVRKLFAGTLRTRSVPPIVRTYPTPPGWRGRPESSGIREPRRPRPGVSGGVIALPEPRKREAG
jgi:hypothetical protein